MPLSDSQTGKIVGALQPLFADPEFVGVTDFNVAVTITPVVPQPEVVNVDVAVPSQAV